MGIKSFRPITPGRRGMTGFDFKEITKPQPEKSLLEPLKRKSARNNKGRITMHHKGGGHKRRYRRVDFLRNKLDVPARVVAIEYDPNRNCRIALLYYKDGIKSYILAPLDLKVGNEVISSSKADIKPGNCLPLSAIPTGTLLHNLETHPKKGGQMVRGAGVFATLVAKGKEYCQVKLPSGEVRQFLSQCKASIGQVGNTDHEKYLNRKSRTKQMEIQTSQRKRNGNESH